MIKVVSAECALTGLVLLKLGKSLLKEKQLEKTLKWMKDFVKSKLIGELTLIHLSKRQTTQLLLKIASFVKLVTKRHYTELSKMKRRWVGRRRDVCYLCLKKGRNARSYISGFYYDFESCKIQHHPMLHIGGGNNHMVNLAKD